MDLIEIIRNNKLMYLKQSKLTKRLAEICNAPEGEINTQIINFINDGTLFVDEQDRVIISRDKGYIKAKLELNKKGYGFASVENLPDVFIPSYGLKGALDGDDVLIEITNHKSDDEFEGVVVKILKHNKTLVVGTYVEGKSKNVVFSDDQKCPEIRIYKGRSKNAKNNDKVWVKLDTNYTKNLITGEIIEVLGVANTPKAEQLSIIRSYNLVEEFNENVKKEVKLINQNVDIKKYKSRADYTMHKVITIDGEDARDFDDALSIQKTKTGYTLFVHIADVSNYVIENSALDKEAYSRGTSVYFPNQVIPMLPKEISNGICSLSEGVNRLVLTVEIEMDGNFNLVKSRIREGIIKSSHRMTYTEIKKILERDALLIEKYADVYPDILLYQQISNKLKQDKRARGEIRLDLPEPYILEDANGEIVNIEKRMQDESHEIIESLMVLTNECVAKTFYDLALPFVYRVHEKPDAEKINKLSQILTNMGVGNSLEIDGDKPISYQKILDQIKGTSKEKVLSMMILRSMMKAKYSPTCLGHFGLASPFYCHFTSPIRRYPDLLIHRIIKSYIHGVPKDDIKSKFNLVVERASEQSSLTEKNADEAERAVDDYKMAVYMQKFLGEEFVGNISGVQEFGIFVELDNGVEGLVRLDDLPFDSYTYDEMNLSLIGANNHFTIGDEVNVVVANVNTQLRQIDFVLAGVNNVVGNKLAKSIKNLSKSTKKQAKNNKNQQKNAKFDKKSNSAKQYYKTKFKHKH